MSKTKPKPNKNRQTLTVTVITKVKLDLDKALLPDDDWRSQFYPIHTMNDVARHIAYNVVANGMERITQLDGFVDRSVDDCKILDVEHETDDVR